MITNVRLKRIRDQVIVITGASSGIGLTTAKRAARSGAAVVLTGRDEKALQQITTEIRASGGQAEYVIGDISDFDATRRVADFTLTKFGRFDTWVNNAGVHIYGTIDRTPVADARRLFDVNYWGVVHGCRAAASFLSRHGGAIINVGSALSDRSVPLQGYYGASKHAVQGYTDALRMELEAQGAPVSVTLIKPGPIYTPIPMHSMNLMEERARLPFPLYDPEVAAKAILFCAEHPRRSMVIGGAAKAAEFGEHYFPLLTDIIMRQVMFRAQKTPGKRRTDDILHSVPDHPPMERGEEDFYVAQSSLYTSAVMHPLITTVILGTLSAGLFVAIRRMARSEFGRCLGLQGLGTELIGTGGN